MTSLSISNDILGVGQIDSNLIEKGYEMDQLLLSPSCHYSIKTRKVVEFYFSRIDSRNRNRTRVAVDAKELASIIGVNELKPSDVKLISQEMSSPISGSIVRTENGKEIKWVFNRPIFSMADYKTVDNKVSMFVIDCVQTSEVLDLIYDLQTYFTYRFAFVRSLPNSPEGYRTLDLYTYLIQNAYRKTWVENLSKVKEIVKCSKTKVELKMFKNRYLKKFVERINKFSNISVEFEILPSEKDYEETKIRFSVSSKQGVVVKTYTEKEPVCSDVFEPKGFADFNYDSLKFESYLNTLNEEQRELVFQHEEYENDKLCLQNRYNELNSILDQTINPEDLQAINEYYDIWVENNKTMGLSYLDEKDFYNGLLFYQAKAKSNKAKSIGKYILTLMQKNVDFI